MKKETIYTGFKNISKELNRAFPKEQRGSIENWHNAINNGSMRQHLQLKKVEVKPGHYTHDLIDTRTNQPIER